MERDHWIVLDEFDNIVATYEIKAGAVSEEEVLMAMLRAEPDRRLKALKVSKEHKDRVRQRLINRPKVSEVLPELVEVASAKRPKSRSEVEAILSAKRSSSDT